MVRKPPVHRGTGLFGESETEAQPSAPAAWRANIDGGSRGNPGPASYGVVIRDPRGDIVARLKKYIGRTTNNVAEYYGLIAAFDYAESHQVRSLHVESDSELLVKQMRGQYKVKSGDLKPLFERAKKMSQSFASFQIRHVYREQNREADALANEAMDEVSGARPAPSENRNSKFETRNSAPISNAAVNSAIKVRARFRSGVLYPLEDINLPDGAEVDIFLKPYAKS
jgi:ribonuclease HI